MALTTTFVTSNQTTPATGSFMFDNATGTFKIYDGTSWSTLTTASLDMKKELLTATVKFGNSTFYTVEPREYDWEELYNWTVDVFGQPRTGTGQPERKWFISGGTFHFHDIKNRDWFILKWSSE
jgi:hypothetical protein